jgi:hypothetical protein
MRATAEFRESVPPGEAAGLASVRTVWTPSEEQAYQDLHRRRAEHVSRARSDLADAVGDVLGGIDLMADQALLDKAALALAANAARVRAVLLPFEGVGLLP